MESNTPITKYFLGAYDLFLLTKFPLLSVTFTTIMYCWIVSKSKNSVSDIFPVFLSMKKVFGSPFGTVGVKNACAFQIFQS